MVSSESTATVMRAPPSASSAEPAGVEHLVGQQQVVAEAGGGHALHLRGWWRSRSARWPASASRRASAVDLNALTWGRRRGPGQAAAITATLLVEGVEIDDEGGRGEIVGEHGITVCDPGHGEVGRATRSATVSTSRTSGGIRQTRRV